MPGKLADHWPYDARTAGGHIVHMEPGKEAETMREINKVTGTFRPTILERGGVFEF